MNHVVLLGDSIFDNASYVPGGPDVTQHLRRALPGWRVTLLAVDGAVVDDVARQLQALPADATHLVVSAGGNDALIQGSFALQQEAGSVAAALHRAQRELADALAELDGAAPDGPARPRDRERVGLDNQL